MGFERFRFGQHGGDFGDPLIEAESSTPQRLYSEAPRRSTALAAPDIRHRFELCNQPASEHARLHHGWPR